MRFGGRLVGPKYCIGCLLQKRNDLVRRFSYRSNGLRGCKLSATEFGVTSGERMATIAYVLKRQEELVRALDGPVMRALAHNAEWAKTARLLSEENSMAKLARQISEQNSIARIARLMAQDSSMGRMAEHLRSMPDTSFAKMASQMSELRRSSAFHAMLGESQALRRAISPSATEWMVRDMKLNLEHLRFLSKESALFRNARVLEDSLTRGSAEYTFRMGHAALEAANAGAFVNLRSLHAFSGLAGSSERLIRAFAPVAASGLAALPPMLRRAPITEPYLSARALSWFEPGIVVDDTDVAVEDEPLIGERARSFELRLRARNWNDLGDMVLSARDRVLEDPSAPARVVHFCFATRTTIKSVIERLASPEVVRVWVDDLKRRRVYTNLPARIYGFRKAKKWADPVRYILRGANNLCDGYAEFGRFDLVDFLYLLDRLEAATHLKGVEEIDAEGVEMVFHRFLGFMSLLLEGAELNESSS